MATNRTAERFRAHRCAHIVLDRGNKLVRCSIRDLSDTGAALLVKSDAGIPRSFDLLFEAEELVRPGSDDFSPKLERKMVLRPCAIAWSEGDRIGVSFA